MIIFNLKYFLFYYQLLFTFIKTISLLSKSKIEKCLNSEDPNSSLTSCSTKLYISLTIQNAELSDTDYIETIIDTITDLNDNNQTLLHPIKLIISKTPVKVVYPSIYIQDFNYKPYEQIIITDLFSCNDKDNSNDTTCDYSYDSKNNLIPNSQGFCCKCSLKSLFFGKNNIRGSKCKTLNLGTGSATAHCLKFNDLWFSAYEIQQYQYKYKITVNIINTTNNETIETLYISPSNIINISNDNNILIKLIGDFLPSNIPNDLSNYYLTIPSSPKTNIMVSEGVLNWMLFPKNYFTLDGRECDKIGVSFYAFRTHGGNDRCKIEVGSCLNNQIYNYYEEDLNRIKNNLNPNYLLYHNKKINYTFNSKNETYKQFSYILSGNLNTLLSLEINADDIKYVINVSDGEITLVICNDFEAMSNNGIMYVTISNIGNLAAIFYISYKCNENIIPLTGDEISLEINETKTFIKNIYNLNNEAELNECNITLKNSIGQIIDEYSIEFNTTDEVKINKQNNGTNNNTGNSIYNIDNKNKNCNEYCPKFFSIGCFIKYCCWKLLLRTISIIILIPIVIIFLTIILLKIICKINLCSFLRKKNNNNKNNFNIEDYYLKNIYNNNNNI